MFSVQYFCARTVSAHCQRTQLPAQIPLCPIQQIRTQVEAKRDQLSGADKINPAQQQSSSSLLEAPVDTDDAPAQAQRP
ncbi:hypothetical protein ALQ03_100731 [Pseudomonas savastanoi pv. glycinea]|uniref:Uncharacterized protein n=1 Tax=Pseudomonas savastanoi pv. glycinea TaxID=318 RepID=A0A3M3W3P1_PSESG|nr:hypothetical protein ALQ97_04568 [Pseudomonas savastanoi pv. glycinea]RML85334.1 hypothetical protein ALQ87_04812 [Pseudomonas savastanoi pv. glycinea]RMO35323.1 hypothetical protein ALQ43_05292 [Pseudomonas savastanoi pv. glycinea]RMO39365.1 hypothetical protein ALQ42_100686 [Pseudomonas savastanoi pv. glycinea]RMO52497.1 hypothetical protein ALQ41_04522 [Pseudomonas savastanoi pv. glycinea]